jgi:molybdopterin converting factor small subunit
MRVTVEFFGPAREAAGTGCIEMDCAMPTTAQDCVTRLARDRGGRLAHLLLHGDRLAPSVLIAVNDRQASGPVPLSDGDQIAVIPPVSGGAA